MVVIGNSEMITKGLYADGYRDVTPWRILLFFHKSESDRFADPFSNGFDFRFKF